MRVPQLPPFSGEIQKVDVYFEVCKYELLCVIGDVIYPNALFLQTVRRSLKVKAREILLTVDSTATPSDILSKLEGIFGIVSSRQYLLQQFYLETQHEDGYVAEDRIRIENLHHIKIIDNVNIPEGYSEDQRLRLHLFNNHQNLIALNFNITHFFMSIVFSVRSVPNKICPWNFSIL